MVNNASELIQMTAADGLALWEDGPGAPANGVPPNIDVNPPNVRLWVVRDNDVPHAAESNPFAESLPSKVIKHSNLTGGQPAHSGGELVFVRNDTIVINGCSGRYGPQSAAELIAVAEAFKKSGYAVWCLGYDPEAAKPHHFGDVDPVWVA